MSSLKEMFNFSGLFLPKKMIGVDIGTSSIKIVELSGKGQKKKLENYGQAVFGALHENREQFLLSSVPGIIREVMRRSGMKTREAVFAVPDFSTFFTSFDIPYMSEKEIPDAIFYTAARYIPLPMSEVSLDWKVVAKEGKGGGNGSTYTVFLAATPNQIIQLYKDVAKMAGLKLYAVEAESLGIARILPADEKTKQEAGSVACCIDIGVKSSSVSFVEGGFVKSSYSISFDSSKLSADSLLATAPLVKEVKNMFEQLAQREQKTVSVLYLTGGAVLTPGLKELFEKEFNKPAVLPNCFSAFSYPAPLQETLKSMSPVFAVAAGASIAGLAG